MRRNKGDVLKSLLQQIEDAGYAISEFILSVVESQYEVIEPYQKHLLETLPGVVESAIRTSSDTRERLDDLFRNRIKQVCIKEMKEMTKVTSGFHFGAVNFSVDQL